jgi:hypothetical protein
LNSPLLYEEVTFEGTGRNSVGRLFNAEL